MSSFSEDNDPHEPSLLQTLVMNTFLEKHMTSATEPSSALDHFLLSRDANSSMLLLLLLPRTWRPVLRVGEQREGNSVKQVFPQIVLALKLRSLRLLRILSTTYLLWLDDRLDDQKWLDEVQRLRQQQRKCSDMEETQTCCHLAAKLAWVCALECLRAHRVSNITLGDQIMDFQVFVQAVFSRNGGTITCWIEYAGKKLLDLQDADGKTALHYAAEAESLSVSQGLVQFGANCDIQDRSGMTPLMHAVASGKQRSAKILILLGADPNLNVGTQYPLHRAVAKRMISTVRCLLDHGANVDAKDASSGLTALMNTIKDRNFTLFYLILRYCSTATIELRDNDGKTALRHAADMRSTAMVRVLLQHGASVDNQDSNGVTPLTEAIRTTLYEVKLSPFVKFLVEEGGADVNIVSQEETALHIACTGGNLLLVQYLVMCGANVNARANVRGSSTPLMDAMIGWRRGPGIVKYLCQQGANVHLKNICGQPALHLSVLRGSDSAFKTLIAHGANIFTQDNCGETPLHTAIKYKNIPLFDLILRYANATTINIRNMDGKSALFFAAKEGSLYMTRRLLQLDARVNIQSNDESTPLMETMDLAFRSDWEKVAKLLIEAGANVNVPWDDGFALHKACFFGSLDLVKCLVNHGAHVNAKTGLCHCTPLMKATWNREYGTDIVRYLCQCGANVHMRDIIGRTVLHYAAEQGTQPMVRCLLSYGASVITFDQYGEDPLDKARAGSSRDSIVRFIVSHYAPKRSAILEEISFVRGSLW